MLYKLEVMAQLLAKMKAAGVRKVDLARECEVSEQAVSQWFKTGRIDKRNLAVAARLSGTTVDELIMGRPAPEPTDDSPSATLPSLTQHDLDLIAGYRTLTEELQTAVWSIIDDHLRRQHPDLAKAMGPRDIKRSLSAEPRLRTKQILAQGKPSPAKPAPLRPKKEPRR